MSSYDELLKQVVNLKLENSQLHLELQGNSSHVSRLENEASNLKDVLNQVQMASGMQDDVEYSFADETMCREHMAEGLAANFEDSSDPSDLGLDVDDYPPIVSSNRDQRSLSPGEPPSGGRKTRKNEKEIIMAMQQLEKERINLVQEMEAEEKNRKWYYDQIEMITRKIRSLPVNDTYANQNPGLTRSHLDFEVKRLRETMHQSFGSNEEITQRRDSKMQKLRQIDAELMSLHQQREQLSEERERDQIVRDTPRKQRSQSPPENNELSNKRSADQNNLDISHSDQVTMGTQTADLQQDGQPVANGLVSHNISTIYHGAWPINTDVNSEQDSGLAGVSHQDIASVMSFNSTNTSSTHSSIPGALKRGTQQGHQILGQPLQQQVGSKVEMVYGMLSLLGTHDNDDMSRTLLAMSSSQDSCIAMRQSGCMPLLIQLLHGSDKDSGLLGNMRGSKAARARAAAALHNIVHSHPDDKRGRREARVLRLLEQIRAHCDQLKEMSGEKEDETNGDVLQEADAMNHHPGPAIATLMKLSFDEEHRHAICTLGGLHAIAELLQVDQEVNQNTVNQYNVTMRRYACMALTNLTFGDGTNKALLCSMKSSMEALVLQLTNQNEDLCQVAASVLRNLSWKADLASKKTLREVGAVTTLMRSAMVVKKETTLKSILSALWNLSAHCSENKADICAVQGALEFLVSSLTYKSPSKTTSIIENGGGILRNVSSHIAVREEYRKILRFHGCMQILLKHLRSPSLTIVSNACGTLWNLSARCAEDQQALWEMGAVTMLRNLVNSKHKMISMGSSAALKNLLAARPAVRGADLNQLTNANRPTLHVRKQRALEADIDQSLSETCENVESPRDSPVETNKTEKEPSHFVYPVYQLGNDLEPRRPLMRGQFFPRSQSGDNSFMLDSHGKSPQRVARSGSQDSVGSTHSDISHDRSRLHGLAASNSARIPGNMHGSLERHKELLGNTVQRFNSEGACERNPLGPPNSRILQVMQEVALHAGIDGQGQSGSDQAVGKTPNFKQPAPPQPKIQQKGLPSHALTPQQAFVYHRIMQQARQQAGSSGGLQMSTNLSVNSNSLSQHEDDEKPLDYSRKYRDNEKFDNKPNKPQTSQPPPTLVGNYMGKPFVVYPNLRGQQNNIYFNGQPSYRGNPSYAETDLDDPEPTDYSARYGVDFSDQYGDQTRNYSARYEGPDPNCADCKYEEARRTNDMLEQTMPGFNDDQITMFYTEGTPYLSTATSLTDLSAAVKILEEAEQQYPADQEPDAGNDEMVNFSSKYGETDSQTQQKKFNETDSRAGSQTTDQKTGTTVIPNYHLAKPQAQPKEYQSNFDDGQERSFHDTQDKNAPPDQTKTYYEEGTPVCFSRVSSLSSLHSSEAADRQDKNRPSGPLQSIEEAEDMNSSIVKMPPPTNPTPRQQKNSAESEDNRAAPDSAEKEHKTVTFDEKEQVQETPMMFSRSTSLGSLSSFDTQSVHSSVFSEYSRRASEVVSPSELPDSPSETMPPSPKRTKSPERFTDKKSQPTRRELLPESSVPQFTAKAAEGVRKINPTIGGNNTYRKDFDTESLSKAEFPKVYAVEGTPPVFSDTLSELSMFSANDPCKNTFSQKDNLKVYADESNLPIYSEALNQLSKLSLIDSGNKTGSNSDAVSSARGGQAESHTATDKDSEQKSVTEHLTAGDDKEDKTELTSQNDDHDSSSMSEVSEGEEDILASIINSAMPNSSKKMRKSSSDNAIKKRSANSSKADSGTSSRSKTAAKSSSESASSKNSSTTKSAKRCLNLQGQSASVSNEISPASDRKKHSSGDKPKGTGQKPKQHRDVKRVIKQSVSLDDSTDSTRSYADEDNPFNLSSTKTVVTPPVHKQSSMSAKNPIVHKADSFTQRIGTEDTVKRYATEDTPFSGSGASSPKSSRKNTHHAAEDLNQDAVKSYATEGTPFSASPKLNRRSVGPVTESANADTVKSYATEDTPFSGSVQVSPKMDHKKSSIPKPQVQNVKSNKHENKVPNAIGKKSGSVPNKEKNQRRHPLPALDMNNDSVKSFATEDTPLNGSSLPSPKPHINPAFREPFNPASFLRDIDNFTNGYEDSSDVMKSYATEGTPQNFSRTGSFSDLSSVNTNNEVDQKMQNVSKPVSTSQMDDSQSDNSSIIEENEDLLSEIIQSAIPPSKPGKSRRSMDRRPEGAEGKDTFHFDIPPSKPKGKSKFQPLKTSSVSHERNNFSEGSDTVRTYAVEGTPSNFSTATSLSDLTVESTKDRKRSSNDKSYMNSSTAGTYGTSNDSVFLQSESAGTDSMKVYAIEGTPQSFSCNESLSSLSIISEDKGSVSEQIKNITDLMVANKEQNIKTEANSVKTKEQHSESRSSNKSLDSLGSARDMERHVIGQSSEDSQSVSDASHPLETKSDETKKYQVEGTPGCFSRNSSLSSISDLPDNFSLKDNLFKETDKKPKLDESKATQGPVDEVSSKFTSSSFRNTEFSRNSSHSSLIIASDDDDDPDDLALLDACISSAIPPKSKPSREDRNKNMRQTRNSNIASKKMKSESDAYPQKTTYRQYSSGDEAEMYQSHDSRYSNWRKQPHKSSDEIFLKPVKDAKGRPCRRSRSQDNEKILKHQKELSNKELAQMYGRENNSSGSYHSGYRGSYDSLPRNMSLRSDSNRPANADIHLQQIISESQNLSRSMETRVKRLHDESPEKSDVNENEKEISPDSDMNNYFMMCSARTEISVESISKQSFTSIMAPDMDDSLLDGSMLGSFRTAGEGVEMKDSQSVPSSRDTTITDKNKFLDMNSEDEMALEHNASLVVTELINKTMTVSAISNVEEDRFIENETLSLVSNDYMSDTASELSELSEGTLNSEGQSPSQRRPKILKPGDKSDMPQDEENNKVVKGKRKPLYSSKSVSSASSKSESAKSENFGKQRAKSIGTGKKVHKEGQGTKGHKKGHSLRTAPQASSTPVKDELPKQEKVTPPKQNSAQKSVSTNQKSNVKGTPPKSTGMATRIPSAKTSPRNKTPNKPQMPTKQGTFVKETTNTSAPVIIPLDGNVESRDVKKRQKKRNDSSSRSRPTSDCSRHSNRNSGSSDSALESWSKALNSYNFIVEPGTDETESRKKDIKPRRSVGSNQVNVKKNLNSSLSPASKIPSPNKVNLNKSGSGSNLRQAHGNQILKSNSGSSLGKIDSGNVLKSNSGSSLVKTESGCGSNQNTKRMDNKENLRKSNSSASLKSNSRPGTPVNKKGSSGNIPQKSDSPLTVQQSGNKKNTQKTAGSKMISGLWKKESSKKDKSDKQNKSSSKLPVANSKKSKVKDLAQKNTEASEKPVKRDSSPRPTVNRNTVVLSETTLDGINRSTTYEKLSTTNDQSQVPTYDENNSADYHSADIQSKIISSHRPAAEFEVGVEYSLDDAWSANVEKSIEAMSRSIEEAKNKKDSFYTEDLDISKMNLDESPAKRLSKSGSMSEIELEFGRINSGTWKKKKSQNDFSMLPNADETCKTLPLVKRAESLNLSAMNRCHSSEYSVNMSVYGWNQLDSDIEGDDIWVKRDDCKSGMNTTKSKKKGFRGSSGFLPIKNVVKHMFGSKKSDKDKDKQSKSFSVSDKDTKKFEELRKMSESMTVRKMSESMSIKAKKEKEPKPSKAELKQMKAELKASKAEAKAEAKALKKEAKLNKNAIKGKNKSKTENIKVESRNVARSDCSDSSSSLKKSAEDLIDIDRESDEEFANMTSSSASKSESSECGTMSLHKKSESSDFGMNVNMKSLPQSSDNVKTSVFPQQNHGILVQETKTSPQAKVPPFNYNPPRSVNNTAENEQNREKMDSQAMNVRTDLQMARRKLSLRSDGGADEEEGNDGKRKCIVTTV